MLSKIVDAMNMEVELIGGVDAAIAACDRMYQATFRSEKYPLGSQNDWQDEVTAMKIELAVKLFIIQTGSRFPERPSDDADECELDGYYYGVQAFEESAESWFDENHPEFMITKDTEVVSFCNYKGEGDGGLGLYTIYKELPVFVDKNSSFNAVS